MSKKQRRFKDKILTFFPVLLTLCDSLSCVDEKLHHLFSSSQCSQLRTERLKFTF